jgi:SAM-dependent methyltransferase
VGNNRRQFLLLLAWSKAALAQVKESDFVADFVRWVEQLPFDERKNRNALFDKYRAKLVADGVETSEIDRRIRFLQSDRARISAETWNRFFNEGNGVFNSEPNMFLTECVRNRKPGLALDVGMGQGRNAIYLAQQGWQTTGIDSADRAMDIARKRTADLGLKLETVVTRDTEYNFGESKWDLVLFSWTSPAETFQKVISSLRPGGIVVVEAGAEWFPTNGLMKMFEALRIVKYEVLRMQSDFFNRQEMDVVRLLAEKAQR